MDEYNGGNESLSQWDRMKEFVDEGIALDGFISTELDRIEAINNRDRKRRERLALKFVEELLEGTK